MPAADARQLAQVVDALPVVVTVWDEDLRLIFANAALGRWVGADPVSLRGRHIRDIFGAAAFALDRPYVQAALAGRSQQSERTLVDRAGRAHHVQVDIRPFHRDAAVAGVVHMVHDISRRIAFQVTLRAATDRLGALAERNRIAADVTRRLSDQVDIARAALGRSAGAAGTEPDDHTVETVQALLDDMVRELRSSIKRLRDGDAPPAVVAALYEAVRVPTGLDNPPTIAVAGAVEGIPLSVGQTATEGLIAALGSLGGQDPAAAVDVTLRVIEDQVELRVIAAGQRVTVARTDRELVPVRAAAAGMGGSLAVLDRQDVPGSEDRAAGTGCVIEWRVPANTTAHGVDQPGPRDLGAHAGQPIDRSPGAALEPTGPVVRETVLLSEAELGAVLDDVPAAVTFWDAEHRNLFANALAVSWMGRRDRAAVRGRCADQLVWADVAELLPAIGDLAGTGATTAGRVEEATIAASGSVHHLDIAAAPLGGPAGAGEPGTVVIATDISGRVDAEGQMRSSVRRAAAAAQRARVAQDLHDLVIQHLFAAELSLPGPDVAGDARTARIRTARACIDAAQRDLRRCTAGLTVRDGAAPATLTLRVHGAVDQAALGFAPALDLDPGLDGVPFRIGEEVVAVVTETLSNIARHADATEAELRIVLGDRVLTVSVRDNGHGISPAARRGNGLVNIRARASRCGGDLTVTRTEPHGTLIVWTARLTVDPGSSVRGS